jgi:hypothetical protein
MVVPLRARVIAPTMKVRSRGTGLSHGKVLEQWVRQCKGRLKKLASGRLRYFIKSAS